MPLSLGMEGSVYIVKSIGGPAAVRQHLYEIGFNIGTPVAVVSSLGGNIIVKVREARFAIDLAMANRIVV